MRTILRSVLPLLLLIAGSASAQQRPPNIVLIMVDDMGFSDVGSYGSEIETPNLDSIARDGVRFSQFYNAARCSPTRASLLTGQYPHRVDMGHLAGKRFASVEGYRGHLSESVPTLAELLRERGYKNYMVGKWHVADYGPSDFSQGTISHLTNAPLSRGFDSFYGTLLGGNNYFNPKHLFRGDVAVRAIGDGYYYTDAMSAEAAHSISTHFAEHADAPLFLYVAYTAPHWPIQAPPGTVAKYRPVYQAGWQSVQEKRYERLRDAGLIRPQWTPPAGAEALPEWSSAEASQWQAERMAVHAAMIDHVDQGVGRILDALESQGVLEQTLIVFLSDNGASAEDFPAAMDPALLERLRPFTEKYAPSSGEAMTIGNDPDFLPGGKDSLQSIGPHWAQVSNTPFRKYKSWVYEGGVATPLLLRWPDGFPAVAAIEDTPGHVVDIVPTLLQASGSDIAKLEEAGLLLDGVSLLPAIRGEKAVDRAIFFEHEGNRAVRQGRWKLLAEHGGTWELYDMERDRTESRNVAELHPGIVAELSLKYAAFAREVGALDWSELIAPDRAAP